MGDSGEEERSRSPSPPSRTDGSRTMSAINPMGALNKEMKFEQKRGIQLGRPELQKVFDGGRSTGGHVSPGIGKKKVKDDSEANSELGQMLRKQNDKMESHERAEKEEAAKPEFMRVSLKKAH